MSVRARVSSGDPVTSDISRSPQAPCPPTNSQVTALHHDLAAPLRDQRSGPPARMSWGGRSVGVILGVDEGSGPLSGAIGEVPPPVASGASATGSCPLPVARSICFAKIRCWAINCSAKSNTASSTSSGLPAGEPVVADRLPDLLISSLLLSLHCCHRRLKFS